MLFQINISNMTELGSVFWFYFNNIHVYGVLDLLVSLNFLVLQCYFLISAVKSDLWHFKDKGKVHPRTGHEGPQREYRYSSILSLTSALDGCGWLNPRPHRFTTGKDPVPVVQKAGWVSEPVWTGAENLALTGIGYPDRPARSE